MRGVKNEDLDLGLYCKCGALQEVKDLPEHIAESMEEKFWERHSGDGHGEVKKSECRRAQKQ